MSEADGLNDYAQAPGIQGRQAVVRKINRFADMGRKPDQIPSNNDKTAQYTDDKDFKEERMMKSEIKARLAKNCPCCGSDQVYMDNPKWLKESNLQAVSIMCKDCGLEITGFAGIRYSENREYTIEQAYQSALKRWNRRAA